MVKGDDADMRVMFYEVTVVAAPSMRGILTSLITISGEEVLYLFNQFDVHRWLRQRDVHILLLLQHDAHSIAEDFMIICDHYFDSAVYCAHKTADSV